MAILSIAIFRVLFQQKTLFSSIYLLLHQQSLIHNQIHEDVGKFNKRIISDI